MKRSKEPISGSGEGIRGPGGPTEAPKTHQNPEDCAVPQVDGGIITHCVLYDMHCRVSDLFFDAASGW